jgi:thiol-disulfide isomerase/thioredoxin
MTSSPTSNNNRMISKVFRWGLCLSLWVLQCSFLVGNCAEAFQGLQPNGVSSAPPTTLRIPFTRLYQASSAVDDHPISDFQQRLLNRMSIPNKKIRSQNSISRRHIQTSLVQEVRTLKDYKRVVIDETEEDQLVVVWFYSPWCRSCKGVSKGVQALSREYKEAIKFVQVPVLPENAALHQGLGVKSVPFVHVYHPTEGLMEERKLTRKYLPGFHKLLQDYQRGECSLDHKRLTAEGTKSSWSTDSPYEPAPKAKDKDKEGETMIEESS